MPTGRCPFDWHVRACSFRPWPLQRGAASWTEPLSIDGANLFPPREHGQRDSKGNEADAERNASRSWTHGCRETGPAGRNWGQGALLEGTEVVSLHNYLGMRLKRQTNWTFVALERAQTCYELVSVRWYRTVVTSKRNSRGVDYGSCESSATAPTQRALRCWLSGACVKWCT